MIVYSTRYIFYKLKEAGVEKVVELCVTSISKTTPVGIAQFICDTLFGDTVRPFMKQLNDPDFRTAEAAKACNQLMGCKQL